ncbi:MAG: TetR/AcrR family transcriptional regulator [Verrucomicrobiota bacterium]|nr:TetR/AcrR family transcriptional regulator [Verrucomicrobiota bacterium]
MTPRSATKRSRTPATTQPDKPDKAYRKSPAMLAKQQGREHDLVLAATDVLVQRGWAAFTVDEVLERAPLSRGTLYKHFRNREDLGIAIAVELLERNLAFAVRVEKFDGGTRERYVAMVGALRLHSLLHPDASKALYSLYNPDIRQKASAHWQAQFHMAFNRVTSLPLSVIHDGFRSGDIPGDAMVMAERISYGVWSALLGFGQLVNTGAPLNSTIVEDAIVFQNELVDRLLDGHWWKPLSCEFDYNETLRRLWVEYFPVESRMLVKV